MSRRPISPFVSEEPEQRFGELLEQLRQEHALALKEVRREYEVKLARNAVRAENSSQDDEHGSVYKNKTTSNINLLEQQFSAAASDTEFRVLPSWNQPLAFDAGYSADGVIELCKRTVSNIHHQAHGDEQQSSGCVILPGSKFRLFWDSWGLVLISYDLITIPFIQAFQPPDNLFTIVADWLTLIFWTLDMIQGFFVGYFHRGEVVVEHRKIITHYIRTWLVVDLIVVVPEWAMFIFVLAVGQTTMNTNNNYGDVGKFAKFARVARILRLLRLLKMKKFLALLADRIESEYAFVLFNLLQLLFFVLVLNHVVACCWFLIGRVTLEQGMINWVEAGDILGASSALLYATSLHWSLTQFTPAAMEISARNLPERLFSIVVVLFAMLVFSSVVASITASMTALRNLQGDEMRQFWLLRRYLRQRSIPRTLSNRIIKFLEHRCRIQGKLVQKEKVPVMRGLSEALQNELTYTLHSAKLVTHPLFGHLESEMPVVMHRICRQAITLQCYAEKEFAFCLGDEAARMYFVKAGDLEYQSFDDETHKPESWLSEAVLYTHWRHRGDLIACTESELVLVDPEGYMSVMKVHPRPWTMAQSYAQKFVDHLNDHKGQELTDILEEGLLVWMNDTVKDVDMGHVSSGKHGKEDDADDNPTQKKCGVEQEEATAHLNGARVSNPQVLTLDDVVLTRQSSPNPEVAPQDPNSLGPKESGDVDMTVYPPLHADPESATSAQTGLAPLTEDNAHRSRVFPLCPWRRQVGVRPCFSGVLS